MQEDEVTEGELRKSGERKKGYANREEEETRMHVHPWYLDKKAPQEAARY